MKLVKTTSSEIALNKVKKQMIKQFETDDINHFKLKFTKKKEFTAIPFCYPSPAFRLFLNEKFINTYFFKEGEWEVY